MDCSRVCRHETDSNKRLSGSRRDKFKGTEKHILSEGYKSWGQYGTIRHTVLKIQVVHVSGMQQFVHFCCSSNFPQTYAFVTCGIVPSSKWDICTSSSLVELTIHFAYHSSIKHSLFGSWSTSRHVNSPSRWHKSQLTNETTHIRRR